MKTYIEIVSHANQSILKRINVTGRNTMLVDAALVREAITMPEDCYTRLVWE